MSKLKDYFENVVKSILGGIPTQNKDVGDALSDINQRLVKTSYGNLFEMMANLNKKVIHEKMQNGEPIKQSDLLNLVNVTSDYEDELYDLFLRRRKYKSYTDMIKKISRLGRAVKVFRSNIIASDSIKNKTLIFTGENDNAEFEKELQHTKEIFKHLKLNGYKALSKTIDTTLKYGDYFIEIATANTIYDKYDKSKMHLEGMEDIEPQVAPLNIQEEIELGKNNTKDFRMCVSLDMSNSQSILLENNNGDVKNSISLDDIVIFKHKPHNVIKLTLGTEVYGYLIIPESLIKSKLIFQSINLYDNSNRVHDLAASMGMDYIYSQKALDRSIQITKNIIEYLKKNIHDEAVGNNDGLKSVITKLVMSSIYSIADGNDFNDLLSGVDTINIGALKLRFVEPSRMQEFSINVDDYDPYGTSIFDNLVFDAKLLVSDKLTSSIERLTKSVERRIINFDVDNRNSNAIIQILKEKFRKKKTLFDGSTSFDNIPGMVSPFEDYYIPTKNGTPFVQFSTEAPTTQHSARVDDMKFKRDELVGDINIPPAYIGLEENIESKSTLFLQSILFAVEIMDYQETFSECYTQLSDKIHRILNDGMEGIIRVGFAMPVILSSANEIEHINNVSTVKEFLVEIGLDKKTIQERYLPFLDDYFTGAAKTKVVLEKLEHGEQGDDEEGGAPGGF